MLLTISIAFATVSIMNFKSHWSSLTPAQKETLAKNATTSVAYLSQVANGHRNAGADLIDRLLVADSNITYRMMRPKKREVRDQAL